MTTSVLGKMRPCPFWVGILVVVTLASIGTRLIFFGNKGDEWELAPWFFDSRDNSGGIHDLNSANVTVHHEEHDMELLFIGNSYTDANDLAAITKRIIDSQWNSNVSVKSHHPGGQTFKGHLQSTRADYHPPGYDYPEAHELREWLVTKPSNYSWVILQEQSQIPGFWGVSPEWNDSLTSCEALDKLVRRVPGGTAQTMFFLTWGRRTLDDRNPGLYPDFLTHQWRLSQGYEQYMEATSTPDRPTFVAPVGLVFEAIYMDIKGQMKDPLDPDSLFYRLYRDDGSHPSMYGSYLAGLTLYSSMLGDDPRDVEWIPEELDRELAKQIQRGVAWTILETTAMGMTYPWQTELLDEELP